MSDMVRQCARSMIWIVCWWWIAPAAAQNSTLPPYYGSAPYGGGNPPQVAPPSVWPNPSGTSNTGPAPSAQSPVLPPPSPSGAAGTLPTLPPFDPYATNGYPSGTGLPGPFAPSGPSTPSSLPPYTSGGPPITGGAPLPAPPTLGLGDPAPLNPPNYPPPFNSAPATSPWGLGGTGPTQSKPLFDKDPFASSGDGPPFQRLFQDTGFRYTYLWGDSGDQLQIHEVDVSTTAVFPNFLTSTYDLRISPGFTFDFLDGPSPPVQSELPARLYAAYLDTWWNPQITQFLSAEINVRSGIYSDFETFTKYSLRTIGTGVGVLRVTPSLSVKLGAAYIDRNRVVLLPAAGLLWEPNPQTRWDIFFPAPKLAQYWRTVRNTEMWWYVGAEYGGGSWTFERTSGASERVDINDIRVFLGLEGWNLNRFYGFLEVGYVFDRDIYYVVMPEQRVALDDTFMLRAGFSF